MINYNIKLNSIFCFFFVLFAILGYKISYFDLQIFMPSMILFIIFASGKKIHFDKNALIVGGMVAALLVYQSFLQVVVADLDFDSLLRLLRVLIVCILVSAVIGSKVFSSLEIENSIFITLLCHAILINIAAILPSVNEFLSHISENDRIKPFRASGLLAGFDMAGLLCVIGAVMLLLGIYKPVVRINSIVYLVIFSAAAYFTSRVTVGLLLVIFVIYFFPFLFRERSIAKRLLMLILFGGVLAYILQKYLLPIVDVAFSLGYFDVDRDLREEIISRHAVQDADSFLWSDMIFLPRDMWEIFFGTGVDTIYSDVGYVKDIFRYGVIGVIFSLLIYYKIYRIGVFRAGLNKRENYILMLRMTFFLVLLLTLKNNYFFTRTIFPLLFLLVSAAVVERIELRDKMM